MYDYDGFDGHLNSIVDPCMLRMRRMAYQPRGDCSVAALGNPRRLRKLSVSVKRVPSMVLCPVYFWFSHQILYGLTE